MKLKTALIISGCLLLAGAGYWFFFVRNELKAYTEKDRHEMFDPFSGEIVNN